jgi:TRAP-type mannitol/chloroaromatic compound transport system permease large subunit
MKGIVSSDVSMQDIYWSITPYVLVMILILTLTIFFPGLAVWFPNMMIE